MAVALVAGLASPVAAAAAGCRNGATGVRQVVAIPQPMTLALNDGRLLRLAGITLPWLAATGRPAAALSAPAAGWSDTTGDTEAATGLGQQDPGSKELLGRNGTLAEVAGGRDAAEMAALGGLADLATGHWVMIDADPAPDRYGRGTGAAALAAASGAIVGEQRGLTADDLATRLVAAGWALAEGRSTACPPYARDLLEAEAEARAMGRGFWGTGLFRIESAHDPALVEHAGGFAVIEGQVISVGQSAALNYLDFGPRWSLDFTVTIAESERQKFVSVGLDPAGLGGTCVRVRGWLEAQRGGLIRLTDPAALERVRCVAPFRPQLRRTVDGRTGSPR